MSDKKEEKKDGKWVTINGNHIFIKDGQTVEEAMQDFFARNNSPKKVVENNKKAVDKIENPKTRKIKEYWIWYDSDHKNGITLPKDTFENAESKSWWKPEYTKEIKELDVNFRELFEKSEEQVTNEVNKILNNSELENNLNKDDFLSKFTQLYISDYGTHTISDSKMISKIRNIYNQDLEQKWSEIQKLHVKKGKEIFDKMPELKDKSVDSCVKVCNPHYLSNRFPRYMYDSNCQRCAAALEMRFRGKNVIAKPLPQHGDHLQFYQGYCKCFVDYDKHLKNNYEGQYGKTGKTVLRSIQQEVQKAGPGSRFIVRIAWKGIHTGHVFNAINDNGTVKFLDGQDGDMNAETYFDVNGVGIQPRKTEFIRVDNLELNETIDKYCEVEENV